jgi:hypothetical protein
VSGLPAGLTATFSPEDIVAGQPVTLNLAAAGAAPTMQNAVVTVTGAALASVPPASVSFLVDVMPMAGSLPQSRSDYISTEGSPNSAVYDPGHNLIFSSNPSWNRIDVISNISRQIVKSIPVRGPRGLDITQDHSRVWVTTASQQVFSIDTGTLDAVRFMLPNYAPYSNLKSSAWQGQKVFALADGTLLLTITPQSLAGSQYAVLWDPGSNVLSGIAPPTGSQWAASWENVMRTGDGKRVYSIGWDSGGASF